MESGTYVILPAKDEERYIKTVIEKCKKYCKNIIVVDDGSSDRTRLISEKSGVTVLSHVINLGKGAAMKTGCEYAIGLGAKKIIFLDSDDQHDPSVISTFENKLDVFDCVLAYRDFSKIPFYRRISNIIGLYLVRILFGVPIRDVSNGFRGFNSRVYDKIVWDSSGYEIETEMIVNIAVMGLTFTQVKTDAKYHEKYKGVSISDAFITAFKLFWWRLVKSAFARKIERLKHFNDHPNDTKDADKDFNKSRNKHPKINNKSRLRI
jgi:glycosyltransferase involved in cell wall biosynthesis